MKGRVLVVDNYDSFTYNLVQAIAVLGPEVIVRRNDEISLPEARSLDPTHLVISPGPGRPEDAGLSIEILLDRMAHIPVLGVCLGHQALAVALGASLGQARSLVHGKASEIRHDRRGVFRGLPQPLVAGRYHSLAIVERSLPAELEVTARTPDGEIMGLRHRSLPSEGVQFHPESVLTQHGDRLIRNFLDQASAGDRLDLRVAVASEKP